MQDAAVPPWLKKRLVYDESMNTMKEALSASGVATVCEESLCPNLNECFSKKEITFLILGEFCTRSCGFCSVSNSPNLKHTPGVCFKGNMVDPDEPRKVADAVDRLSLKYVVITSVTRDDLDDGGAGQFVKVIESVRLVSKHVKIEVLVPDFKGTKSSIKKIAKASADVFGHNIETVRRLYPIARRGADYDRSLSVLRLVKELRQDQITKSSIMVGLGEEEQEVIQTMQNVRSAGCDILTIGQYLRPHKENLPVSRLVRPEEFERYAGIGYDFGFKHVSSGPFVRSSYYAEEGYNTALSYKL